MYYVTLRRPRATSRFARQDPQTAPDPCNLTAQPQATPAALPPDDDVLLPVPWRVQVQFPSGIVAGANATGIPTEIELPPPNFPGNTASKQMLVQMFPVGTMFVDEISGLVFTVIQRRVVGADGDKAFLTLDREVFVEDLDLAPDHCWCANIGLGSGKCFEAPPTEPEEQLRTVWVYPPPAEPRSGSSDTFPFFSGNTPVVDITVRTLALSPSEP